MDDPSEYVPKKYSPRGDVPPPDGTTPRRRAIPDQAVALLLVVLVVALLLVPIGITVWVIFGGLRGLG